MQTYLKTKPVGIQLLLFISLAAGVLMVVFLVGSLILSKVTGMNLLQLSNPKAWPEGDATTLTALRGLLVLQFLGLFLIPCLLYAYFADPQPGQFLGMRPPHSALYWVLGIAALLLAIPLVEYTGVLNKNLPFNPNTQKWMQGMEEDAGRTIQYMLAGQSFSNLVKNLIFIALFAGLGEELLFRGILQRLVIQGTKSPWLGIIVAAFLFSFFHLQFYGFVPRFLLGIVLGAIYWYSGSIWPAVVAHFLYDAFYLTAAYLQPKFVTDPNASFIAPSALPFAALISAAIVAALVWLMVKKSRTTYSFMYGTDDDHQTKLY